MRAPLPLLLLLAAATLPASAQAAAPVDACLPEGAACAHAQLCALFLVGPCFHAEAGALRASGSCGVIPRSSYGLPGAACGEFVLVGGSTGEGAGAGVSAEHACLGAAALAGGTLLGAWKCLPS